MAIQSGPGTKGTRHIARRWPVDEGLIAGTTKQANRRISKKEESHILSTGKVKGT